jgi:hypothetical protein
VPWWPPPFVVRKDSFVQNVKATKRRLNLEIPCIFSQNKNHGKDQLGGWNETASEKI